MKELKCYLRRKNLKPSVKTWVTQSLTLGALCVLALAVTNSAFADAPTYRGKIIVLVDSTLVTDSGVYQNVARLQSDLAGDGWHVLFHMVDRGPEYSDANKAMITAHQVREVRAIIRADYDADPANVKAVFIIGHVAIPFSGDSDGIVGNHADDTGAHVADLFYGEPVCGYGTGGWSDTDVCNNGASTQYGPICPSGHPASLGCPPGEYDCWPFRPEIVNIPGDGKFDQDLVPCPLKLAVGRVDLSAMPAFSQSTVAGRQSFSEAQLVAMYFNKDHDFRCNNFNSAVTRTGVQGYESDFFGSVAQFMATAVASVVTSDYPSYDHHANWFNNFTVPGQGFLLGFAAGHGGIGGAETIGSTSWPEYADGAIDDSLNNFNTIDSCAVFVGLVGSRFGDWDQTDDFLRAPLANPYSTGTSPRYGYGLAVFQGGQFLEPPVIQNLALGGTIGETMFSGATPSVSVNLMGDPTLRLHTVLPPSGLGISAGASSVTLNWTASSDPAVSGYNIYYAPTPNGPYTLANPNGPLAASPYSGQRPSGSTPDNFYMVRAVKQETTPIGNYNNMSEGVMTPIAATLSPYLTIISEPASVKVLASTGDGIPVAAAFTVDAVGCDGTGSQQMSYQWYYQASPTQPAQALHDTDNGGNHFEGAATSSLLIKGVQAADAGDYHVVINNSSGLSVASQPLATLWVGNSPTANNDSYSIAGGAMAQLNVLNNDSDGTGDQSRLRVVALGPLSDPNAGSIQIDANGQTVDFTPGPNHCSTSTFTYMMTDGAGMAGPATVTVTVTPQPGATPTVSSIPNQVIDLGTSITVPFTVGDNYTSLQNLQVAVVSSDQNRIPNAKLTVSGSGANRTLQIKPAADQTLGNITITVQVTDQDCQTATTSFTVTTAVSNVPIVTPDGSSASGNQLIVNAPPGSIIEIQESPDLNTWTSLGTITVAGDYAIFTDLYSNSGSGIRFYRAILATPPQLSGSSVVGNNFEFSIAGTSGAQVEVEATEDFLTWVSLGTVTLSGGSYHYIDPEAAALPRRFYQALQGGLSSVNSVGFVNVTIPGAPIFMFGNPLNAADDSVNALFSASAASGAALGDSVFSWNGSGFIGDNLDEFGGGWFNPNLQMPPGTGFYFENVNSQFTMNFIGDVPHGLLDNTPPSGWSMLASKVPQAGYVQDLGLSAPVGDSIELANGNSFVQIAHTASGWQQGTGFDVDPVRGPYIPVAGAFFYHNVQGTASWQRTLSINSPIVNFVTPAYGATFTAPASVSLSAVAFSEAGIATVQYFVNGTSIGTPSTTAPYAQIWNNVAAGTYTLTAEATDINGITTVSTPVTITVNPITSLSLSANGFSGSDFQLSVAGLSGAQVNLLYSEDLATWTPLPAPNPITLGGGAAAYSDVGVKSQPQRFYMAQEGYQNSGNAVGFANVTIPGAPVFMFSNPLNAADNSVNALFSASAASGAALGDTVFSWNGAGFIGDNLDEFGGGWGNPNLQMLPGMGFYFENVNSQFAMTIIGEVPHGLLNNPPPLGWSMLASKVPQAGYVQDLGLNAAVGDSIELSNGNNFVPIAYTASGWQQGTGFNVDPVRGPYIGVGGSFFYHNTQGTATWQRYFPISSPTVNITTPGATYPSPASVSLSATATSDQGMAGVDFYANGTYIGTASGAGTYTFVWNNVTAGHYSITAKATDNLGVATISAPISITVN